MRTVSIVRDRGQLTIPDSIRSIATWTTPSSVVSISIERPDEIVIRPHQPQEIDWDKLWGQIRKVRTFRGKGQGNLSAFIAKDRETRR